MRRFIVDCRRGGEAVYVSQAAVTAAVQSPLYGHTHNINTISLDSKIDGNEIVVDRGKGRFISAVIQLRK